MGIGNISIWQLLIVLLIVIVIFGTKKLRNMGGDVGGAVKNFKDAMKDGESEDLTPESLKDQRQASETSATSADKTRSD